jgi:hypothetical protein
MDAVETKTKIFIAPSSLESKIYEKANNNDTYLQDLSHYIDKKHMKEVYGINDLRHIRSILVNDERDGAPHYKIKYNKSYTDFWGNQPIYGNVVIVLSDKAYRLCNNELKTDNLEDIEF